MLSRISVRRSEMIFCDIDPKCHQQLIDADLPGDPRAGRPFSARQPAVGYQRIVGELASILEALHACLERRDARRAHAPLACDRRASRRDGVFSEFRQLGVGHAISVFRCHRLQSRSIPLERRQFKRTSAQFSLDTSAGNRINRATTLECHSDYRDSRARSAAADGHSVTPCTSSRLSRPSKKLASPIDPNPSGVQRPRASKPRHSDPKGVGC
jgi:hypothetical protein